MSSVIPNQEISAIMNRAFKATPDYTAPTYVKIGANQATPSPTDTDLTLPLPFTGTEAVDSCDATTGWNGSADASPVSLDTTTRKEGTASLNLGKTGTTTTSISYEKTVTSRDFTNKTLFGWVYLTSTADLISTGTGLIVRYGSDNANYYEKTYNISTLSTGWNLVFFTSATPTSTTGSPTLTAMDYLFVQFFVDNTADVIASGRIKMDDWKLASTDDFLKTIDSITIDETNRTVVLQGTARATDAVGFNITGFSFVNNDATPRPVSIAKVTSVSKSNTDELIVSQKVRFRRVTGG